MQLIETIEVGATPASGIDFVNLPQDGIDLLALISGRTDRAGQTANINFQFNGSNADFTNRDLYGVVSIGVSSTSNTFNRAINLAAYTGDLADANTFGNVQFYISNYSSTQFKSYSLDLVNELNIDNARQAIMAGTWANTSPINTLRIGAQNCNLTQYSTLSLYKITAD